MKRKNLKRILKENMRRFGTKNLNEEGGSLQQATPEDADWESDFNDINNIKNGTNSIFGWWLDLYYSIGSKLAYIATQIDHGNSFEQFEPEILKIIDATKKCIQKIPTLNTELWREMIKYGDANRLINSSKDDLIGELEDLVKSKQRYSPSDIYNKLMNIADDYQMESEDILTTSWDYAKDPDEDNSDNLNQYSNN